MKAEIKQYLETQKAVFEATRDNAILVAQRSHPMNIKSANAKKSKVNQFFSASPNMGRQFKEAREQLSKALWNVGQLEKCIAFIDGIKED